MTQIQERNQSIETDTEMKGVMELSERDLKQPLEEIKVTYLKNKINSKLLLRNAGKEGKRNKERMAQTENKQQDAELRPN